MSNLLEKASIITTPTAYSSGFIHSVKPEENLGPELITNGDYSNGSTGWILGSQWQIINNQAVYNGDGSNNQLKQNISIVQGKTYRVQFNVISILGRGKVQMQSGAALDFSTIGFKTFDIEIVNNPFSSVIFARLTGNVNMTLDNVSVKEIIGADFTFTRNSPATRVNSQGLVESVQILGSNVVTNGDFSQIGSELITNVDFATNTDWTLNDWTIADGKASLVNGSSFIQQDGVLEAGKTYKIQYEILEYSSGTIRWRTNQVNGSNNTSVKLVTDFITVAGTSFAIQGYNSFTGSISNISAVEIIDWTAGDGWSFGGNKASCDGTQTDVTNLIQTISTNIQNQLVKISFTLDISAGTLSGSLFNSGGAEFDALTTSGNYSVEATSSDVNPIILFQGNADFVGSISNVVIKSVTNDTDLPRINYENGSGSWLLEASSSNLITYSEDFSQWTKTSGVTITPSYQVSPNGEVDSSRFLTTGNNFLYKVITLPSISEYTFSIWVKSNQNSLDNFTIHINGSNSSVFTATSNWQRFQHTFTSSNASHNFGLIGQSGGTDVEIWGAQLEQKAFATSYIPTSGSPQTRAADLATNAGNSDLINSTEGVLYAEIARDANGAALGGIQINDGGLSNSIRIFFNQTNTVSLITVVDNANNVIKTAQSITSSTDINKFALRYKLNDYKMYYNGSELWSRTTNALVWPVGTLNNIDFKNQNTPFNGKAKCVAVFKEALTDAELICLTTI